MKSENHLQKDSLSKRLSGLRSTRVDVASLDFKLKSILPPAPVANEGVLTFFRRFLSPKWSIVSCLLIIGLISLSLVIFSAQPAVASTTRLAELYHSAISDHSNTTHISTIAEARAALSTKWPDAPQFPDEPSDMKPMSCCVHEMGKKQMACINFIVESQPVILALADSRDVCSPEGKELTIGGVKYLTGSSAGINMVMSQQDGTWLCLMGKLPHSKLAELAVSLRQ